MTEKIIPSQPKPTSKPTEVPPLKEETNTKINNETVMLSGMLADYVNVDLKFLTTIILMLCTIGAVVVYFPRVSFDLKNSELYSNFLYNS